MNESTKKIPTALAILLLALLFGFLFLSSLFTFVLMGVFGWSQWAQGLVFIFVLLLPFIFVKIVSLLPGASSVRVRKIYILILIIYAVLFGGFYLLLAVW